MDLFDVVRACFRRWYVILPLLLVVGWYGYSVYSSVKPVYYSYAVLSIAPPNFTVPQNLDGAPVPRNGLLDVGGPSLIANLLALGLKDPGVVSTVVAGGGQPNYISRIFPVAANTPELPLVMIENTQVDSASALKTVEQVVAQADATLRNVQRQANVPDEQMVVPFVVNPPSAPVGGIPSRTKATGIIVAAGAAIAILAGLIFDIIVLRFKARRQRNRQLDDGSSPQLQHGKNADSAESIEPTSSSSRQTNPALAMGDEARSIRLRNMEAADGYQRTDRR